MVVNFLSQFELYFQQKKSQAQCFYQAHQTKIIVTVLLFLATFIYFKPQKFADIWLTRDQQGALLFHYEKYELAHRAFTDVKWQAYSLYGAEKFDQSALLYNQFSQINEKLAHANALAQGTRYVQARSAYQAILKEQPDNQAAADNLVLVQGIIEDINRMSESQKAESGDSPKELDDKPQRADGAEKQEARKRKIEQLNAQQLLLDPSLNQMWLRQVQKDPAQFLSRKFAMQKQLTEKANSNESAASNEQ